MAWLPTYIWPHWPLALSLYADKQIREGIDNEMLMGMPMFCIELFRLLKATI